MPIEKFIQEAASRYSCHFVAWMFPTALIIVLLVLYDLWLYFADKVDIGTWQTIAWFAILFVPPVIMPCIILMYILTFVTIQHFEQIESDFRLKDSFFYKNKIFQLTFLFLLIIGTTLYLLLVCYTTYTICTSDNYRHLFYIIGIPVMISILPVNLFIIKFLHNIALHKK